jgi:hypothetical protein
MIQPTTITTTEPVRLTVRFRWNRNHPGFDDIRVAVENEGVRWASERLVAPPHSTGHCVLEVDLQAPEAGLLQAAERVLSAKVDLIKPAATPARSDPPANERTRRAPKFRSPRRR